MFSTTKSGNLKRDVTAIAGNYELDAVNGIIGELNSLWPKTIDQSRQANLCDLALAPEAQTKEDAEKARGAEGQTQDSVQTMLAQDNRSIPTRKFL